MVSAITPGHRVVVMVDANVASHHPDLMSGHERLTVPAGEHNKTRDTWAALTDELIRLGCDRRTTIVAIGGGVTTDIAGFVAATFLRGVPWISVPTTTLGMCDAAVGGKTGVDTPRGKNLVGAFHQPSAVIADPKLLGTLPEQHYRDGLAEAVKHAAIVDAEHFNWLTENVTEILAREETQVTELVRVSCAIKSKVVAHDEREAGMRAILNAGHTIAHAIEHGSQYSVSHGQAVALGLIEESRIGERMGPTSSGTADALSELLQALGFAVTRPEGIDPVRYREAIESDKKNRSGEIHAALLSRIGAVARAADGGWTWQIEA